MGSIPDYETAIAEVIRLEAEVAEANLACKLAHSGESVYRNEMIRLSAEIDRLTEGWKYEANLYEACEKQRKRAEQDLKTMMASRLEQEGIYKDQIRRLKTALRDALLEHDEHSGTELSQFNHWSVRARAALAPTGEKK